jgi:hypothetical protein
MNLRFWSWIYRKTGYYSIFAEVAEYRYLKTRWKTIEKYCTDPKNDLSLEQVYDIEIGSWQIDHGFYIKFY